MAKFRIKDSQTGKTLTISGDSAPTEQELEGLFSQAGLRETQQPSQQGGSSILNSLKRAFVTPFTETVKVAGGAAFETAGRGARALTGQDPFFNEDKTPVENPFLSMRELEETNRNPLGFLGGQVGRSAQIASLGIPVGGGGAATTAGRVGQAALRGGAVGAIRGFTAGDEEIVGDKTEIGERLQNTLAGAGTGAVTAGLLQGAGEGVKALGHTKPFTWSKNFASEMKNKLSNKILRLNKSQVQLDFDESKVLQPGNRASNFLQDKLDDGDFKIGNYREMFNQTNKKISGLETKIGNQISKKGAVNKTIGVKSLTDGLDDLVRGAKGGLNSGKVNGIEKVKNELIANHGKNGTINVGDALDLRRLIEADKASTLRRLSNTDVGLDDIASARIQAQLKVSDQIRDWLRREDVLGGEVGKLLQEESGYIGLRSIFGAAFQNLQKGTGKQMNSIAALTSPITNLLNRPEVIGGALQPPGGQLVRNVAGRVGGAGAQDQKLTNPLIQMLTANQ